MWNWFKKATTGPAIGPAPNTDDAPQASLPEPLERYPIGLSGESFRQNEIKKCRVNDRVALKREPDNPYDARAIVVLNHHGEAIGYIPKDSFLHRAVHDERKGCSATILSLNEGPTGLIGVVIQVELDGPPVGERRFRR